MKKGWIIAIRIIAVCSFIVSLLSNPFVSDIFAIVLFILIAILLLFQPMAFDDDDEPMTFYHFFVDDEDDLEEAVVKILGVLGLFFSILGVLLGGTILGKIAVFLWSILPIVALFYGVRIKTIAIFFLYFLVQFVFAGNYEDTRMLVFISIAIFFIGLVIRFVFRFMENREFKMRKPSITHEKIRIMHKCVIIGIMAVVIAIFIVAIFNSTFAENYSYLTWVAGAVIVGLLVSFIGNFLKNGNKPN